MYRWVSTIRTNPAIDMSQDVTMTFAEEIDGRTTIAFTRPRVTSESEPVDVSLDSPIYILWATGPENNFNSLDPNSISNHGSSRRGVSSRQRLLPFAADCPSSGKRNIAHL